MTIKLNEGGGYRAPSEPSRRMTAAEVWCLMNGWIWPGGRPAEGKEERDLLYLCFGALDSVREAGIELWQERMSKGLDPVTGAER